VEESNVDDNMQVIDPSKMRHVTVAGGRIEQMSGLIDQASHLNLDFPDHRATVCIIAEKFQVGARVKMESEGLVFATVPRSSYGHYGYVDYTQRLVDMINAVKVNEVHRKKGSRSEEQGTSSSTRKIK
jgi:hypothetical protein